MTLEICGGALDGKMVSGPIKEITWTIDGENFIVVEFRYDRRDRKILIPAGSEPKAGVELWLERHA